MHHPASELWKPVGDNFAERTDSVFVHRPKSQNQLLIRAQLPRVAEAPWLVKHGWRSPRGNERRLISSSEILDLRPQGFKIDSRPANSGDAGRVLKMSKDRLQVRELDLQMRPSWLA